jgi:hypothetical protein
MQGLSFSLQGMRRAVVKASEDALKTIMKGPKFQAFIAQKGLS